MTKNVQTSQSILMEAKIINALPAWTLDGSGYPPPITKYKMLFLKMNKFFIQLILILSMAMSCKNETNQGKEEINQAKMFLSHYDKVQLVSYNKHRNALKNELKLENNSINIPTITFIDEVVLEQKYAEKIFQVLYSKPKECSRADCYQPRHILLFYKKDTLCGFYEFCAACGGSRTSDNINIPAICTEQGNELIKIFKEMKLKNDGQDGPNYTYF